VRGAAALILALLAGCAVLPRREEPITRRWPVMGTYVEASLWGEGPSAARTMERLRESLDRSDLAMSNWRADSGLSRLNAEARGGLGIAGDPVLADCVDAALDAAQATGGAFDPTVGPLLVAWGLRPGPRRTPDDAEIETTLRHVGWERVQRPGRGRVRFETRGMELDLGGIGKGCALDVAVGLAMPETRAGLIDLGRSLAVWGRSPTGDWRVAIAAPGGEDVLGTLTVYAPSFVSTSSQEENPGHIVDPRTGRAADTDVLSATALAGSGTVSDLLSTALLVAGSGRARAILDAYPGARAVLLVREGGALTILASASLEKRLRIEQEWRGRLASVEFTLP
jgi:thiamine biosynthesis lipoprotein